jgi:hypothetical protein
VPYLITDNLLNHRNIFQLKMVEHWNLIQYKKNWDQYCSAIFKGLNSLIAYLFFCGQQSLVMALSKQLETIIKPGNRKELQNAIAALSSNNILPLHKILQLIAGNSECASFYTKVYITSLQFFAFRDKDNAVTGDVLSETVLLNIMHDLHICRDLSKISNLEKKDYVKVISVISSTMIESKRKHTLEGLDSDRYRLAKAAQFLGPRMRLLIKVAELSKDEEMSFWGTSSFVPYTLLGCCSEVHRWQNMFPHVYLPKFHTCENISERNNIPTVDDEWSEWSDANSVINISTTDTAVLTTAARETTEVEILHDLKPLVNGLNVKQLRAALLDKGLNSEGKKKILMARLVNEGGYCTVDKETAKKRKRNKTNTSNDKDREQKRQKADSSDSSDDSDC